MKFTGNSLLTFRTKDLQVPQEWDSSLAPGIPDGAQRIEESPSLAAGLISKKVNRMKRSEMKNLLIPVAIDLK